MVVVLAILAAVTTAAAVATERGGCLVNAAEITANTGCFFDGSYSAVRSSRPSANPVSLRRNSTRASTVHPDWEVCLLQWVTMPSTNCGIVEQPQASPRYGIKTAASDAEVTLSVRLAWAYIDFADRRQPFGGRNLAATCLCLGGDRFG